MLNVKSVRPMDAAIIALLAVVLVLAGYLGYSMWVDKTASEQAAPATRVIDSMIADVKANPNNLDARMKLAQALTVAGRDREAAQQYKA
ncbi:MAG: hypothetical protein FDZ75_08920, partial [Actinobacteria bacterium]